MANSQYANAIERNGNKYFEVCLPKYDSCVVGVFTKNGTFAALIPEGKTLPGMVLADVFKIGPNGEKVARIRTAEYNALKAAGMEKMEIDPDNIQAERDKVQERLNDSFIDCMIAGATCGATGLAALGTGGWGISLAALACISAYRQCKALDAANIELFEKRKELDKKLAERAAQLHPESAGGGGGERGPGRAPSAGPGATPDRPAPGRRPDITGHEGQGTSGQGHKPIIFN